MPDVLNLSHIKGRFMSEPTPIQADTLREMIPSFVDMKQHHTYLTPEIKALVVTYAFIGLSELVSASSGQPVEAIWKACIERSIHNLKKDGQIK